MSGGVRGTLCQAADRAERPLPDPHELQRLTEALAELYDGLRVALRPKIAEPADVVGRKVRQAQEDAKRELLGFIERGELSAFLETPRSVERLPYTAYWARPDATPTPVAERIFDEGTAPSSKHPGETGIVKVLPDDFRKIAMGFFGPAGPGEMAVQVPEDVAARWGWIGLHRVVEVIKHAKGDAAWLEVKTALRLQELPARCIADGVTKDFEPHWLDFLARSEAPETRAVLWFDREKAWRKAGRAAVLIPDRAEDILVPIARCAVLWPDCAWPTVQALIAPQASSVANTSLIPTGMPGRPSKGKDLIQAELRRRIESGAALDTLKAEVQALADWYKIQYPQAQQPKMKTLENSMRAIFRARGRAL